LSNEIATAKNPGRASRIYPALCDIVRDNDRVRGNHKISFRHNGTENDIVVTDKQENHLDLARLLSKQAYAEYVTLLYWWRRS